MPSIKLVAVEVVYSRYVNARSWTAAGIPGDGRTPLVPRCLTGIYEALASPRTVTRQCRDRELHMMSSTYVLQF
uniref:Uncharacterized protein n=1 Tax=Oryza punctata TaxID=4537 RepID=A0A0E0LKN7_ORYPU